MCHIGQTVQRAYHSPFISLPASTSPCTYTPPILYTTEGSFFKHKSDHINSLVKTLPGLLMPLHGHKPGIISPFTFPTPLPSHLLQSHAAFSHTWPPKTERQLPRGSLCPNCCPADTCMACYHTSLGVLLHNHLYGRTSLTDLSRILPLSFLPDFILFSTYHYLTYLLVHLLILLVVCYPH